MNDTSRQEQHSVDGPQPAAYTNPVDAIVLAGTHKNPDRLVRGRNKALLDIEGRALVRHVVDALTGARTIGRVFVVGPQQELEDVLAGCPDTYCVQQQGKLVANGWAAVRAMEAKGPAMPQEQLNERPVLVISCDLPLISAGAVDDFVGRCAAVDEASEDTNAMLCGIAEDEALAPFYGSTGQPGVVRPLVQMSTGRFRLSNIYIFRPYKLTHAEFLQTSFTLRKAKDWHNVAKLGFSVFSQPGGWFAAWMIFRLQLTYLLRRGQGRWYWRLRRGNTFAKVEHGVGTVLGGTMRLIASPYGGLSLDVDDEEDYAMLHANYGDWIEVVNSLDRATGHLQQEQGELRPERDDQHREHQAEEERQGG